MGSVCGVACSGAFGCCPGLLSLRKHLDKLRGGGDRGALCGRSRATVCAAQVPALVLGTLATGAPALLHEGSPQCCLSGGDVHGFLGAPLLQVDAAGVSGCSPRGIPGLLRGCHLLLLLFLTWCARHCFYQGRGRGKTWVQLLHGSIGGSLPRAAAHAAAVAAAPCAPQPPFRFLMRTLGRMRRCLQICSTMPAPGLLQRGTLQGVQQVGGGRNWGACWGGVPVCVDGVCFLMHTLVCTPHQLRQG
eukprot:1147533-Pelagomonas_calceolata.AAC.5